MMKHTCSHFVFGASGVVSALVVNYLQLLVVVHLLDHRFRLLLIESDCIPHQLKSRILASDTGHRSCHRSLPGAQDVLI
jgi:hypothetical protein